MCFPFGFHQVLEPDVVLVAAVVYVYQTNSVGVIIHHVAKNVAVASTYSSIVVFLVSMEIVS